MLGVNPYYMKERQGPLFQAPRIQESREPTVIDQIEASLENKLLDEATNAAYKYGKDKALPYAKDAISSLFASHGGNVAPMYSAGGSNVPLEMPTENKAQFLKGPLSSSYMLTPSKVKYKSSGGPVEETFEIHYGG